MATQNLVGYSAVPEKADMVVPEDLAVLLASAERELGAFMKAVTDSFGPKEGRLAAEDWLQVLDSREELPGNKRGRLEIDNYRRGFPFGNAVESASVR